MPRAPSDWRAIVRRFRGKARHRDPEALEALLAGFRWRYDTARNQAIAAVCGAGSWVVPRLLRVQRAAETAVERRAATDALGLLGDSRALPGTLAALKDPNMVVRRAAMVALLRLKAVRAVPSITRLLRDESGGVRVLAADILGRFGDRRAVVSLGRALRDSKWYVRQAAARSLGTIGDPRAIPALREALRDTRPAVARAATVAFRAIAPRHPKFFPADGDS